MNAAANLFTAYLDNKGIKYTAQEDKRVTVSYSADNTSVRAVLVFGDDGKDVALRVFSLVKVPEGKVGALQAVCSDLNRKWRWCKFYLDKDNEVTVAIDAVITPETTGPVAYELVIRTVGIVDKAYPDIMKALWS